MLQGSPGSARARLSPQRGHLDAWMQVLHSLQLFLVSQRHQTKFGTHRLQLTSLFSSRCLHTVHALIQQGKGLCLGTPSRRTTPGLQPRTTPTHIDFHCVSIPEFPLHFSECPSLGPPSPFRTLLPKTVSFSPGDSKRTVTEC